MKKILSIILIIFSFILIGFTIFSKNFVKKNSKMLENKLIEYCETILAGVENDNDYAYQITVDEMERIFELDISEFKKNKCSLTESYIFAQFEGEKLVCTPTLVCK